MEESFDGLDCPTCMLRPDLGDYLS